MTKMDANFYKNLLTMPIQSLQSAVAGGMIIAVASTMYYLLFGNILGMSGVVGSLIKHPLRQSTRSKALIIAGIIFSSALINFLYNNHYIEWTPFDQPTYTEHSSITRLIVSGALVGIGTQLANGCTSGHGLCGLPRLSSRSFVAVIVFLVTAIVTATTELYKHIPQISQLNTLPKLGMFAISTQTFLIAISLLTLILFIIDTKRIFIVKFSLFVIGVIFGCGLMIAGMSQRSKIYGFLVLNKNWDPSLLLVLMTGVLINAITFNLIKLKVQTHPQYSKQPMFGQKIEDPRGNVNLKLILGAFMFGLGWGIGGLCPGPFILTIANSIKIFVYWGLPCFFMQKITNLLTEVTFKINNDVPPMKTNNKSA